MGNRHIGFVFLAGFISLLSVRTEVVAQEKGRESGSVLDSEKMAEQLEKQMEQADKARKRSGRRGIDIGNLTINMYLFLAIIFVGIPLTLFLGKFLFNIIVDPFVKAREWRQYKSSQIATGVELKEKAGQHMRTGNYKKAADAFLKSGDTVEAAHAYEKAGEIMQAAMLFERSRRPEDAARLYESVGKLAEAAKLFSAAGQGRRAAKCHFKAGDRAAAARELEHEGDKGAAAAIYEELGNFYKAARLFEESGNLKKSADLYESILKTSGREQLSDIEHVAEVLDRASHFEKAAELFIQRGNAVRAIKIYIAHGKVESAAALFVKCGGAIAEDLLQAIPYNSDLGERYARMFIMARDYKSAAKVMDNMGKYEEAGELALKGSDCYLAAEMFEMAGKKDRAAALFEKAGSVSRAAGIYADTGQHDKAAACYASFYDYFNAAKMFDAAGKPDSAIQCYMNVRPEEPAYRDAQERLGRLAQEVQAKGAAVPRTMSDTMIEASHGLYWLKEGTYFREFSLDELKAFLRLCQRVAFPPRSRILAEGTAGDSFYIITNGRVTVMKDGPGGRAEIAALGPGEHFGEISILAGIPVTADVVCEDVVETLRMPRESLYSMLAESDAIAKKFYHAFASALMLRLKATSDGMAGLSPTLHG